MPRGDNKNLCKAKKRAGERDGGKDKGIREIGRAGKIKKKKKVVDKSRKAERRPRWASAAYVVEGDSESG